VPDVARPEEIKEVDLSETLDSVMRLLEGRCRHAGVSVHYDYRPEVPRACAAPNRLRQLVMNLIINAIEAMPGGGSITIRTQAAPPGRIRLSVEDTGEGIRAAPPERVFELFFSSKDHSSGLGLYIARQLVLAQGGKIGCKNTDEGALFWVELPAADKSGPAPTPSNGNVES
jgi:signal transduction histidine kinase